MRTLVVLLAAGAAACLPVGDGRPAARDPGGGRVRDLAGVLSVATERKIDMELATLEATTTDQVGVVTVPTLNGRTIEAVSLDYARRWALGRKDLDNGVLVMLAPRERRVRVEVGTGLEALLTDDRAGVFVAAMVNEFKTHSYDAGIEIGVDRIERLLLADRRRPQFRQSAVRNAA